MKKSIQLLLSLLLSCLVIYGGSGVNAYFYCCDDCRSEGTEVVIGQRCCEIHAHTHDAHLADQLHMDGYNVCELGSHDNCGVERVAFSWESFTRHQELQPQAIDLNSMPFMVQPTAELDPADTPTPSYFPTGSQKPPNLSNAVYLTLLTTLII